MDSSFECGQSPASPVIKRLCRMLCIDTEELIENFDDFSEFVKELNDYAWRLNKEEKRFLDSVLRLQKGLTSDASFVIAVENVKECHTEDYEDKLAKVKDSYAATKKKLKENVAAQGEQISNLMKEKEETVSTVEALGEADAMKRIVDGKLVPYTPPQ
ncbi:hypothetical protein L195_g038464 [Trifolium pratense]|uniref:Uncharacterized protein n=1 Tax=Trifolium pratense TaxID=57577 RepID=A0A2K3LV66_TRIPR|nr:hypothetical protein L195_g038464 [Trifolium pratense]